MSDEVKGWSEVTMGATLYPFKKGTSYMQRREDREYLEYSSFTIPVSDWRTSKPVYNESACINCQNCWVFCPDASIISKDKLMRGVDYDHCKGCGICVEVCPTNPKSLLMFEEAVDLNDALKDWPEKIVKEKK